MHEVTCFHCGHIAHISPDAERCAVCNADLSHLITPDYASGYFYDRAAEMAAAGEVTIALLEVERGLAYRPSSELNLLGAILAQRLGEIAKMRHYVAAIPVDDALRNEAEWLLRSQQPDIRSAKAPSSRPQSARPSFPPSEPAWTPPVTAPVTTVQPLRRHELLYGLVAVLLVLLVVWLTIEPLAQMVAGLFATPSTLGQPVLEPEAAINPVLSSDMGTPALVSVPLTITTVLSGTTENARPTAQSAANPAPITNEPPPFDLKGFLAQTNRPELADLPVTAVLREGTLTLQGTVPLFDHRQALLELAARAPSVSRVDGAALQIQRPATYVVQEGDTLWFISYKLYGDNRVDQLYTANQDVLASPEALRVGQELKVP
jgi:hypothetical protein